MISSINIAILLACILIFAIRAYNKGIWLGALGLVGLVCAYGLSLLLAPKIMDVLKGFAVQSTLALFVGMLLVMLTIFVLISSFFTYVPGLLFPAIKNIGRGHRYWGAAFGSLTGAMLGVVLIWLISLLTSSMNRNMIVKQQRTPGVLERASSRIVASAVRSGIGLVEEDEFKANAAAALISSPHSFSASFRQLARSAELQEVWSDGETQFYMDQSQIDALIAHEKFQALLNMPQLQELLSKSRPSSMSAAEAERYLARQMSFVFRRMRLLRSDERVVSILDDPEVRALSQQQNPIALLANDKIQQLVTIVMEDGVSENDIEALISPDDLAKERTKGTPQAPKIIYRWMDDSGKMRYTDKANTPPSRRKTAEIITYY